jgi:3-methyladenine DNA glycosylase/8-oxoguanine DNA glycosylase
MVPVAVPVPFSLDLVVRSHGWYQCPPFRWIEAEAQLLRGERLGDDDYLITAQQTAPDRLEIQVSGPDADGKAGEEMVRRMRRMLRLDEDLSGFHAAAAREPRVADVAARGWGRILRGSSLWEDVAKALLGTNVAWRQAVRMIDQLARLAPASSILPDLPLFPTPDEVVAAGEETLRARVRCGYRAPYLVGIARGVLDGTFDLDDLDDGAAGLDTDEVRSRLLALPGIGPATSAYLLVFLGHYDRPTIDSATVAYAAKFHFDGEKRPVAEVAALFEHYAPYRALGAWGETWQAWLGEKERKDQL